MYYDKKFDGALEATSTAASEGSGEMSGDMDLGGDLGGEDDLMGDMEGEDAGSEEESVLLSEPGARNQPYLTPNAKGKHYTKVNYDGRQNKRQQNMNGQMAREKGKNTTRNVFPGLQDIKSLVNGVHEQKDTNYNNEENLMLANNVEIKKIIDVLSKKQGKENDEV